VTSASRRIWSPARRGAWAVHTQCSPTRRCVSRPRRFAQESMNCGTNSEYRFCAKLSRFRTASSAHAPPDERQASWRKKQQREQHDRVCTRNRDSELDESMLSDKAQSDRGRQNRQDDRWPDQPQARDSAATPL